MRKPFVIVTLVLVLLSGCDKVPVWKEKSVGEPAVPSSVIQQAKRALSPIYQNGIHPTVRSWYYDLHPHAFACKDDPYSCKECPVGKSDRVIDIPHGDYVNVPDEVNLFFACDEINMLIPEHGGPDGDSYLCEREPADGFVRYREHVYSCSPGKDVPTAQKQDLGAIKPGETKTVTIPLQEQP